MTDVLVRPEGDALTERPDIITVFREELSELKEATFSIEEIATLRLMPHGPRARRINRFGIRLVSSLSPRFASEFNIEADGGIVGVGWYTVPAELCTDHFDTERGFEEILPAHYLLELGNNPGACLIRSLPSFQDSVPMIDGRTVVEKGEVPVFPGQEVTSVAWITGLRTDALGRLFGTAHSVSIVGVKVAGSQIFDFVIASDNDFRRGLTLGRRLAERAMRSVAQSSYRVIT